MENRRRRWFAHNDMLECKPMVLCFPEGSWPELIGPKDLACEDAAARGYEMALRQKIYWHDVIADDAAQESCWYVHPAVDLGDYGVAVNYSYGEDRGSYRWEHPLKNLDEDLDMLRMPEPTHDRQETDRRINEAYDLFVGILDVRLRPGLDYWTLGMTSDVIRLIGLDNLFLYMYDNPDGLHRLMAFMRDSKMKMLDWYECDNFTNYNIFTIHMFVYVVKIMICCNYPNIWSYITSFSNVDVSSKVLEVIPKSLKISNVILIKYYIFWI
jgi:hypothetical protein